MAVNKPVGNNARKGAVKKRSQIKTKLGGAKPAKKKKAAKKFKGVRRESAGSRR
jgi:hypothetical protein